MFDVIKDNDEEEPMSSSSSSDAEMDASSGGTDSIAQRLSQGLWIQDPQTSRGFFVTQKTGLWSSASSRTAEDDDDVVALAMKEMERLQLSELFVECRRRFELVNKEQEFVNPIHRTQMYEFSCEENSSNGFFFPSEKTGPRVARDCSASRTSSRVNTRSSRTSSSRVSSGKQQSLLPRSSWATTGPRRDPNS